MRERIIGLETEYSLSHIPAPGETAMPSADLSARAIAAARGAIGYQRWDDSPFWPNGGKVYLDLGHVECASPECRGVHEAVLYDKSSDRLIELTADAVEGELGFAPSRESIFAAKNNVDAHGVSFGSHENYLVARSTPVIPDPEEFFHYLARVLVPFLVSRTILCGSGIVQGGFQISQRAAYINSVSALDTRQSRPIINTRDEPHADAETYRRLHLILGDANMAEWADFLKLGTTSIVLTMAEDVFLDGLPELQSPVSALWAISKDPTLKTAVPLANGRSATALEIQQYYLDSARAYFDDRGEEEEQILERWSQVLSELAREPRLTVGKLDWVTKKDLLENQLPQGTGWDDPRLKALDFQYHSLRSKSSIYGMLAATGLINRLLRDEEIEAALRKPPKATRARVRSAVIEYGGSPRDWTECAISDGPVNMEDPFDWISVDAMVRLGTPPREVFSSLAAACSQRTVEVVIQAVRGLADLADHTGSSLSTQIRALIVSMAAHHDRRVRLAAIEAMAAVGGSTFRQPLREATQDTDYRVRFAAECVLRGEP